MLTLRLAWRNVWRNRRRSGIVLAAVAVGVAGVVLSMAINNGMIVQMVETAIETDVGHLQIHAGGYEANPGLESNLDDGGGAAARVLESVGDVQAWAPRVRSEALVYSTRASAGVRLVGIDPDREAEVSLLAGSIVSGRCLDADDRGVLIGRALARRLQLDLGGKLVLSVQNLDGDLSGAAYRVTFADNLTGVQLGYDTFTGLRGEILTIYDWQGVSAAFVPMVSYDPLGSMELILGCQLFAGQEASEFGSAENRTFLILEWFF